MDHESYELPNFSRNKIEKAGKVISKYDEESSEYNEFLPVVDNWRASHAYPLDVISELVRESVGDDETTIVVHRIKRLDSIVGKLKRAGNTGLFRMQDLGGCRVIVDDLEKVYVYLDKIKGKIIESGHEILPKEYDYIKYPNSKSGYRSYHVVVKFHCEEDPEFDGMYIEIQIRTKLEHVWATTVEIMDAISEETLKAGTGKKEYMRYFKLVSALFSISENTPIVEGVPNDEADIIEEIYSIDREEHIQDKLLSYNEAIKKIDLNRESDDDVGYYLLITDRVHETVSVRAYKKDNVEFATKMYQAFEKVKKENRWDVVLVSVTSIDNITSAYPNYFFMTEGFLRKLSKICSKHPEKSGFSFSTIDKGANISESFAINYIEPNVPRGSIPREASNGVPKGHKYCIPRMRMNLGDSYLRFSAPAWENDYDADIDAHIDSLTIAGPAIILTKFGGCYYINCDKWSYVCEEKAILIQNKEYTDDKASLLLLMSWLKTNLFTWDILWNYHSYSPYPKEVFKNLWTPCLPNNQKEVIIRTVNEILDNEFRFTKNLQNDANDTDRFGEIVDKFNKRVSRMLSELENIYDEYYGISKENRMIIQQELSVKNYYVYE